MPGEMKASKTARSWSAPSQLLVVCCAVVVGGCASMVHRDQVPKGTGASTVRVSAADAQARIHELWTVRTANGMPVDFCLGPGDLVVINVFHFQEMTNLRARVSATGMITLPLLGEVRAAGLTERQLEEQIAARLRQGIMKNPQVSVFIEQQQSQQVSVTGAVSRPGLISLTRDNRSVADIISEAGGLTEQAGSKVFLHPAKGPGGCPGPVDNARPVQLASARPPTALNPIEINLNEAYDPPNENPLNLPVIGGDSIVVNRGRFFVNGWVTAQGQFDISPGVTAFSAISSAGGPLWPADLSHVVVWRNTPNGGKQRIDVDLKAIENGEDKDVALEAGDVVHVPPSTMLMVPYMVYWITQNIVRVGAGVSLI